MSKAERGSPGSRDHDPPPAEILGEDAELLWNMAVDMEPEHGRLWIYDSDALRTVAFTPDAMEYLREMLPAYKRERPAPRS